MTETTRYRELTKEFSAEVAEVDRVGDTHVRVVLGDMPALSPLDTIAVAAGGELRRYTVSSIADGTAEFVAFRTRRGPATPWLDALGVGDRVTGLAPERPVKNPPADVTRVLVIGDDTAVGVARAMASLHPDRTAVGMVGESREEDIARLTTAEVTVFGADEQLLAWVTAQATMPGTQLVLVGEQALNQRVRQHAFGLGIDKEAVATRTFWRPDRAGLE